MTTPTPRTPGPDHPITIAPQPGRVRVRAGGVTVAETGAALRLEEAGYPAVLYIPRADIAAGSLAPSARTSRCPYKGAASYHDLVVGGDRRADAAWSYEEPYPAVAAIRGHVAFYPDRVEAIETA